MLPEYEFDARESIRKRKLDKKTLNQFKKWYRSQRLPALSEQQQILCLSCVNSLEQAQNVIQEYFKCKSESPEHFSNMDLETKDLQQAIVVYDIAVMPSRTTDDLVVACGKLKNTSYSNFDLAQLFKLCIMILELCLYEGPSAGLVAIIDMKGIGFMHLTKLRLGVVKKLFQYVQDAMLIKLKAVHVVNTWKIIDKILFILKPYIKKELFDVIYFHNPDETEEIFKSVPPAYIPEDYGGSLPPQDVLAQKTYQRMVELRPLYAALEKQLESIVN